MVEASLVKLPYYECHWTSNDDQSTLVQVMAWCRQATSHYLNQCWPRSLSSYGVTRPQWVKEPGHQQSWDWLNSSRNFLVPVPVPECWKDLGAFNDTHSQSAWHCLLLQLLFITYEIYRKTSNTRQTLVGYKILDHLDVVWWTMKVFHLHCNTWLQWIGQRQPRDEKRSFRSYFIKFLSTWFKLTFWKIVSAGFDVGKTCCCWKMRASDSVESVLFILF